MSPISLATPPLEPTDPAQLGRREAGKAERRRRIIQAARELIRSTGNAGLAMRDLAALAGVSVATPYNLFGSKRAIILAVLEDVREFRDRFSGLRSVDPLERVFAAVDLSVEYYLSDPRFYKTLWAAVFDAADDVRTAIFNPRRNEFWLELIAGAVKAGAISPEVNQELLFRQLDHILRSAMMDWVVNDVPPELLGPTVRYGFALVLLGVASPDWRGPLHARFRESQDQLERGFAAGRDV